MGGLFSIFGSFRKKNMRNALDFYPTPIPYVKPVLDFIASLYPGPNNRPTICDPCAGYGNLLLPFQEQGFPVLGYDIDPDFGYHYLDAREGIPEVDWIITNPPYRWATPILRNCLKSARIGVAAFMRLSYLEPCTDRRDIITTISKIILTHPRPKFERKGEVWRGTDCVGSVWLFWIPGYPQEISIWVKE